jgi:hypothetical protein
MLTFPVASTTLEIHTCVVLNAPMTSRTLTMPYPTSRVLSNPLLQAMLILLLFSKILALPTNTASYAPIIPLISRTALLHIAVLLRQMVPHPFVWSLQSRWPIYPQSEMTFTP